MLFNTKATSAGLWILLAKFNSGSTFQFLYSPPHRTWKQRASEILAMLSLL
jgi:hypothetical protein